MGEPIFWVSIVATAVFSGLVGGAITHPDNVVRLLLWPGRTIRRTHQRLLVRWRVGRAERLMERFFQEHPGLRVSINHYNSCFRMSPTVQGCQLVPPLDFEKPNWINDYFMVSALESLSKNEKVVKARMHSPFSWPPRPEWYQFEVKSPEKSVEDRAREIETDSKCYLYQHMVRMCPLESRYEEQTHRVMHSAVPCQRCWDHLDTTRQLLESPR